MRESSFNASCDFLDKHTKFASAIEGHHYTSLAVHELERQAARAHEAGHDQAAKVLLATANVLRSTVPFPVSAGAN